MAGASVRPGCCENPARTLSRPVWEASYAPALISGGTAIAKGETRYTDGDVFSNLFELDFDAEGRCTRFVEWDILHQENGNGAA